MQPMFPASTSPWGYKAYKLFDCILNYKWSEEILLGFDNS